MSLSYDEAVAAVTAPGQIFEITETEVLGRPMKTFAWTPGSLRSVFDLNRSRGDAVFLVYENERWTFEETMRHVDALGAALVDHYGVEKGDRVAIALRNYPEWVVSFAAITSVGAVAVPLNAWWTTEELRYGFEHSGAKVAVADAERVERMAPFVEELGIRTLGVRLPDGVEAPGLERYGDIVVLGTALPDVAIDPDDDATILYTSGTTGHPKGAVSTHRAVCSALMAFACRAAVHGAMKGPEPAPGPGEDGLDAATEKVPNSFILVVPLFHVTGCIPVMLSCSLAGYKLVMMYKWNPERALELIEREKVTSFVGVPTMSWDLLESPDFATRDTSSLVSVGGGGAPAPPELVRRVDSSFKKARPGIGYGMTETNAYGPQNMADDYIRKPTSTGRAVPIMQVRVVGDDGEPVGPGEIGEIEFYGSNLIRGYWNDEAATAAAFHDGWLRTGDLGRIDDEGFVYVEDRAKDMVIRGGENIYCAEVEAVIYEHPAVYEAAVFGIPHDRLGEELVAAIVTRPGTSLSEDELKAHVAEHLAPFKVPSRVTFAEQQLPRSATGKILKRELRDELAAKS